MTVDLHFENFRTIRHRAFILNRFVIYDKTFPMGLYILITWPWPWPLTYIWKKKLDAPGCPRIPFRGHKNFMSRAPSTSDEKYRYPSILRGRWSYWVYFAINFWTALVRSLLKLKRTIKSIIFSVYNRVYAKCMSRLISFVIADSSCLPREESENYNLKNSCTQRDSNPLPLGYLTGTVTYCASGDLTVDI